MFENNYLVRICINISLLIPYYFIYVLKNEIETNPQYLWITQPKRSIEDENQLINEINSLAKITEEITMFNAFPEHLLGIVIPEINYVDIEMGKFTFFNAFFLDNFNI